VITTEEHRQRHIELHHAFDELLADWLTHHPRKLLGETTILELMRWSHEQTKEPTARDEFSEDGEIEVKL
jgi:hypothetical protein